MSLRARQNKRLLLVVAAMSFGHRECGVKSTNLHVFCTLMLELESVIDMCSTWTDRYYILCIYSSLDTFFQIVIPINVDKFKCRVFMTEMVECNVQRLSSVEYNGPSS